MDERIEKLEKRVLDLEGLVAAISITLAGEESAEKLRAIFKKELPQIYATPEAKTDDFIGIFGK